MNVVRVKPNDEQFFCNAKHTQNKTADDNILEQYNNKVKLKCDAVSSSDYMAMTRRLTSGSMIIKLILFSTVIWFLLKGEKYLFLTQFVMFFFRSDTTAVSLVFKSKGKKSDIKVEKSRKCCIYEHL